MQVNNIDPAPYDIRPPQTGRPNRPQVVEDALNWLTAQMGERGAMMNSPQAVKDYLRLSIGGMERECFGVLFLDAQHAAIQFEIMFQGTLTQTSVYPREVVKAALLHNAAAVILCHNHPSGALEPSRADEFLTQTLKTALALVDVRVLDHIIVSHHGTASFAEKGLL